MANDFIDLSRFLTDKRNNNLKYVQSTMMNQLESPMPLQKQFSIISRPSLTKNVSKYSTFRAKNHDQLAHLNTSPDTKDGTSPLRGQMKQKQKSFSFASGKLRGMANTIQKETED